MQHNATKADRRCLRVLADLAYERQLRTELQKLAVAIAKMNADQVTPIEVEAQIHEFHRGVSRELYGRYTGSDPRLSVCRAHFDGILNDEDLEGATEAVKKEIHQFAIHFCDLHGLDPATKTALND